MRAKNVFAGAIGGLVFGAVVFTVGDVIRAGEVQWVEHGFAWFWVLVFAVTGAFLGHPLQTTQASE